MIAEERPAAVRRILSENLGVEMDQLGDDAKLIDLGADSLDIVELAMAFEDAFGVEIEDDALTIESTVAQVIEAALPKD